MSDNIPGELFELLNKSVDGKLDEFFIEFNKFDGKGEGFVGEINFVTLTKKSSDEKIYIAVKRQKGYKGTPYVYTHPLFENEIHFYTKIWPTLQQFYEERTGKSFNILPQCFAVTTGNYKMLGLENLLSNDFVLYDKTKPFDDEHFSFIFKTYGIYHGISMALKHLNIEKYNELLQPIKSLWKVAFGNDTYTGKMLIKLSSMSKKRFDENINESLIKKLELYEENGPNIIYECLEQAATDGVILHGDCWSNNFMFKYEDDGKIKEIKLLDFQIVISGSPVIDLSYCFYSGGSGEIFDKLDHYLQIYHSSLTETLEEFGLSADKLYSFDKFKEEWKKYSKFGYAMGINLWHIKLADKNAMKEFGDIDSKPKTDFELLKITNDMQEDFNRISKELILHMHNNDFL